MNCHIIITIIIIKVNNCSYITFSCIRLHYITWESLSVC